MDNLPELSPFTAAVATLAVFVGILFYIFKDIDLPPGPIGLPLLDYYPFLNKDCHLQLHELAKNYGDITSFKVTGQVYIQLSSLRAYREAYITKGDCFTKRLSKFCVMQFCYDKGMTYEEGEPLKILRKFFIHNLKDYGLTSFKGNITTAVEDSLSATIEGFKKTNGKPFDPVSLLLNQCNVTMQQLLFSGVEIKKKDLEALSSAYVGLLSQMTSLNLLLAGPVAKYLVFPWHSGYWKMLRSKKLMESIFLKIIQKHESTLDEDHPRNIVDLYIHEKNMRIHNKDPTASYFTDEGLVATLIQLAGDASESFGFFLTGFITALVEHPEVQDKMYDELINVVGRDRQPTFEDRSNCPYTNAVILEIIRTAHFFPLFPSLVCSKKTVLSEYRIPEGSMALINFWAIHHDPLVYKNPYTFCPERFIGSPDKPKEETPARFGIGNRGCTGEYFVMMQVFLFLASVVKNLKISLPPSGDRSAIESGATINQNMKICAIQRTV